MAADNGDNNNRAELVSRLIAIFLLPLFFTVHRPGYRDWPRISRLPAHAPMLGAKAESCIQTYTVPLDQKDRRNSVAPSIRSSLQALR